MAMDEREAAELEKDRAEQADGAVAGLVQLVGILRQTDRITDEEATRVFDALTAPIHLRRHSAFEQALQPFLPGYRTAIRRNAAQQGLGGGGLPED